MKIINKKIFFNIIIIFQIILVNAIPFYVNAGLFGAGNVSGKVRSGINDFIETDLNLNVADGLKPLTESINVGDVKSETPEVKLRFSTPNPKEGEEITVSAEVTNITNLSDAYYVWYLKNEDEENKRELDETSSGLSELDKQHILAVQAQAELYFDTLTFDQEMNGGDNNDEIDGNEWPTKTMEEQEADGFDAAVGGGSEDASDDAVNYCYIYDTESGVQYELAKGGESSKEMCPDGYEARCMVDERTVQCPTILTGIEGSINANANSDSSADPSTGNTSTSADSSTDVVLEGGAGARFRILARCIDNSEEPTCINQNISCKTTDGDNGKNYNYDELSTNNPKPFCLPINDATGQVWVDPNTSGCPSPQWYYCFSGEAGCEEATIKDTCGFDTCGDRPGFYGGTCHHWSKVEGELLEPGVYKNNSLSKPGKCDISSTEDDDKQCTKSIHPFPEETGDGIFTTDEERLYHLDPRTDRTTPLALNDEALAVGVGMKDFTWRFRKGDEIGVIVEGVGTHATKHEDATNQTVFALLSPGCKDKIDETGDYEEIVNDKVIKIKTGEVGDANKEIDFYKCINSDDGNNLYVKPGASEYNSIAVDILAGADSESASATSSGIGQEMTISSTASQKETGEMLPPEYVYYKWDIACGTDENNVDTSITEFMQKCKGMTDVEGMGISSLNFVADFPDGNNKVDIENGIDELKNTDLTKNQQQECYDAFAGSDLTCFKDNKGYIKIKTEVNEPREGGGSNFGQSEKIFKIFNIKDNPLKAYKTEIFSKGNLPDKSDGKFEKTIRIEKEAACVVSVGDDEVGTYIGDTNEGRPTYIFKKRGDEYCEGIGGECVVTISECAQSGEYKFTNPSFEDGDSLPHGVYEEESVDGVDKFTWVSEGKIYNNLEIFIPSKFRWNQNEQIKEEKICDTSEDKIVCKVMNNEVVILEATTDGNTLVDNGMVSWRVDGKNYQCNNSLSSECVAREDKNDDNSEIVTGQSSNTIAIPMLGPVGKKIKVDATVNKVDVDTNDSYSLSREFEIVNPSVKIVATDKDKNDLEGVIMGYYEDIDTGEDDEIMLKEQRSNTSFEAELGSTVILKAKLTPNFLNKVRNGNCTEDPTEQIISYKWTINGKEINNSDANNGESIVITATDDFDASVEVKIGMCFEDRRVRHNIYGATLFSTASHKANNTIKINVIKSESTQTSGIKGFFATTTHNAPEYLIFILKMTLLMGIMLFATSFIIGLEVKE